MAQPYSGSCACGLVEVTISAEPVASRQCWCRQCQRIAAGGPTNNAIFPAAAVSMTGEIAHHAYVAASGNVLTHEFCAKCGTPVLARSSARPQFRTIRLGLLDESHGLRPETAIWVSEAPALACIDPALEQWPAQPPAPSLPAG